MKVFLLALKKNWKILILILTAIFAVFLFRRRETDFANQLKKIHFDHQEQLNQINKEREKERKRLEENELRLKKILSEIQAQYESSKKDLTEKKKAEVQTIIKKYGDQPNELAEQLSAVTGFKIILPEKD
jgi:hypothetical protein